MYCNVGAVCASSLRVRWVSPQQPQDAHSSSVPEFVGLVPLAKFKAFETRLDEVRAEHRRETEALQTWLKELMEQYHLLKSRFEHKLETSLRRASWT